MKNNPTVRDSGSFRRMRLFDIYAANLQAVKKNPHVHFDPDLSDIFVCPLCFKYFTREEVLNQSGKDVSVTIEHVPPKALGGKERTLTCFECNNKAGHQLDSHLLHSLELADFIAGIPGSSVDAKLIVNENIKLGGTVQMSGERQLEIIFDPRRSNKQEIDEFKKLENPERETLNMTFRGRRGRNYKQRRPECSLLRIAYLWAFSFFGYGFLINAGLPIVRGQINYPTEEILPSWGISQRNDFPDVSLGINIVTGPKELQSFLVVFDVKTDLQKRRYGVLLPGPTLPGTNIYQHIHDQSKTNIALPITFKPIPKDYNFVQNPDFCFASHEIWKQWRETS
jgi:hypothetical protein